MRTQDLFRQNIAYHDQLNPDVWSGHQIRSEVRYRLLQIAQVFMEYLEVPDFKLLDVVLRGSLANYNYTRYSDFDLHLITNYADLNCDIAEAFYRAKKTLWNSEHDILIRGHEVEVYVEDVQAQAISEGTYSLLDDRWLRQPTHQTPRIRSRAVVAKAQDLMRQIDREISDGNARDLERLQLKIKNMRKSALTRGGEFSTENLAFKILRNQGYIDRLYQAQAQIQDQNLSLP
jgi:hypothetical protein